jgi:hypothetical protein
MECARPHVRNRRGVSSRRGQSRSRSLLRTRRRSAAPAADERRFSVLLRRNCRAAALRAQCHQIRLHLEGTRRFLESPRQWSSPVPFGPCGRPAPLERDGRAPGAIARGANSDGRHADRLGRAARQDAGRRTGASVDDGARGTPCDSEQIRRPAFARGTCAKPVKLDSRYTRFLSDGPTLRHWACSWRIRSRRTARPFRGLHSASWLSR